MQTVIQKYSDDGWYLHMVLCGNSEKYETYLKEEQAKYPNDKFRLAQIKDSDCWWNDPFLAN